MTGWKEDDWCAIARNHYVRHELFPDCHLRAQVSLLDNVKVAWAGQLDLICLNALQVATLFKCSGKDKKKIFRRVAARMQREETRVRLGWRPTLHSFCSVKER